MQLLQKTILLALVLLSFDAVLSAQGVMKIGDAPEVAGDTNLLIDAQVLYKNKPQAQVKVQVYCQGEQIKETLTKTDGFFQLKIGFDTLVTLKFKKEGFVTKLIEVDTRNMPDMDRERGYDAGLFKLNMIEKDGSIPIGLYKKPIARFIYDPVMLNFVVDKDHKKEVKKSFKELDSKPEVIKF